jgi:hypothetical protein
MNISLPARKTCPKKTSTQVKYELEETHEQQNSRKIR